MFKIGDKVKFKADFSPRGLQTNKSMMAMYNFNRDFYTIKNIRRLDAQQNLIDLDHTDASGLLDLRFILHIPYKLKRKSVSK